MVVNESGRSRNELRLGRVMSAHQPHFLPWLGYLDKVARADVFVVVDHVQYERQNFQNRNRIKTRSGAQWVVVPVQQVSREEVIAEKRVNNQRDGRTTWGRKVFRSLECAYGKAPYFALYAPALERLLTDPSWERLLDLNLALLRWHLEAFEVRTPLVLSSSLGLQGAKSEMIVNMCKAVGARTYLSGKGGSCSYLDLGLFGREGLQVVWQQFEHPVYPQRSPPVEFLPRLAAVDLLFNLGPASAAILRGERPGLEAARPAAAAGAEEHPERRAVGE